MTPTSSIYISLFTNTIPQCIAVKIILHFGIQLNSRYWYLSRFKESDAFVGYQQDVAAAVVFQASNQLRKTCQRLKEGITDQQQLWESGWEDGLLEDCSLDQLAQETEGSESWKKAVSLCACISLDSCQLCHPVAVHELVIKAIQT